MYFSSWNRCNVAPRFNDKVLTMARCRTHFFTKHFACIYYIGSPGEGGGGCKEGGERQGERFIENGTKRRIALILLVLHLEDFILLRNSLRWMEYENSRNETSYTVITRNFFLSIIFFLSVIYSFFFLYRIIYKTIKRERYDLESDRRISINYSRDYLLQDKSIISWKSINKSSYRTLNW